MSITDATSTHTPGPWVVSDDGAEVYEKTGLGTIATMNGYREGWEANAELIGSAPEMFAALREACAWARQVRHDFGNQHDMNFEPSLATDANRLVERIETVLAKATGGAA